MIKSLSSANLFRYIGSFTKLRFSHTSISKVVNSIEEALEGLHSGHKILVGGFGLCGTPENLIRHLAKQNNTIKDLTMVTCTCGKEQLIF